MDAQGLTAFQVAQLFFALPESDGFLLAGGAALLASKLTTRPTQDLDLFTHSPVESVTVARTAFLAAIGRRGWTATIIHDSVTFCRLVVHGYKRGFVVARQIPNDIQR